MNPKEAELLRPVEGRQFTESLVIIACTILAGVFVLIPIGVALMLAWWNQWSFAGRVISWYGALIGLVAAGLGLLSPALLVKFFHREKFIIGKDYFQVVNGAKVTTQIPYSNIAKISTVRNYEGQDLVRDFVGIVLANPEDAATLCPQADTIMKLHGWHHRIDVGLHSVPLDQLNELISQQIPQRSPSNP